MKSKCLSISGWMNIHELQHARLPCPQMFLTALFIVAKTKKGNNPTPNILVYPYNGILQKKHWTTESKKALNYSYTKQYGKISKIIHSGRKWECYYSLYYVWFIATRWTVAYQTPLSIYLFVSFLHFKVVIFVFEFNNYPVGGYFETIYVVCYFKSWKMILWKCCTQYASKFGKLSSGHRTGKGQFSFQLLRKAIPKNAQTTAQLQASHTLVK